ncbi:hypothetical protein [Pseudomonas lactis]|uniref:hypothetical protein n=1 Tax=Pseudomonas lactis TaxID=1615674 RepID=UPI003F80169C
MVNDKRISKAAIITLILYCSIGYTFAATDLESTASGVSSFADGLQKIHMFIESLSMFGGLYLLIRSIKMFLGLNTQNGPKSFAQPLACMVLASLLLNLPKFLNLITVTLLGGDHKYCDGLSSDSSGCWNAASSELTGPLRDKVDAINGGSKAFMEIIDTVFYGFLVLGVFTIIKAVFMLYSIHYKGTGESNSRAFAMMFFGGCLCNMGFVIELAFNALKSFGMAS